MATLRTDELNSQEFDAVEYINNYFEPMRISEERKEERRDAAKDFREILLFILALIMMEYDRDVLDWYYIRDQLRKELEEAALEYAKNTEMLQNYLTSKAYNFIEITQNQDLDDPYWTSDERATYEAVNEANDVIAISERQRAEERGAVKKKWRTENDFRVRLTHRLVEGTTIALDALFSVGKDKMRFPHDWYYSEKESYNCRCGLDYLDENDKVVLVGRRGEEVNKVFDETLAKTETYNRARSFNSIEDLRSISDSAILNMTTQEEIDEYFKTTYNIELEGFTSKNVENNKFSLTGLDDMLKEFPEILQNLKKIVYVPNFKYLGEWSDKGIVKISHKGLTDYGTGVHEAAHSLEHVRTGFGMSYAQNVVNQAAKNLGLRKNSRVYKNYAIQITQDAEQAAEPKELFAYAIETARSGIDNPLAQEILKIVRGYKK